VSPRKKNYPHLRDGGKGRGRDNKSMAHRVLALSDWAMETWVTYSEASFYTFFNVNKKLVLVIIGTDCII
jgi:hypothetical protein